MMRIKDVKISCLMLCVVVFTLMVSCSSQPQNGVYNVLDYGAKGDSSFLNTESIQKAKDHCSNEGGGTVFVPPGTYISGTLHLKENVKFEISSGATILGSDDINDYYEHKWGHNKDRQPYHLILGYKASNVEICGGGIIDGNGEAFWKNWEHENNRALRKGNWKLVKSRNKDSWELYDMSTDRTELNNLFETNSEVADSLLMMYETWARDVGV